MDGIGGVEDVVTWARPGFGPYPGEVGLDEFLTELTAVGADLGVFTGRQAGAPDDLSAGVTNDYVADCVANSKGKLIGFASADPRVGQVATEECRRAIKELGLRGISTDPQITQLNIDDRANFPLYELADEFDVPVVITMGPVVGRFANPNALDVVAQEFPNVTFVGSHACYPRVDELIALAYRRHNVYLEASIYYTFPGAEPFIEAARTIIQDKVVYASAFPFTPLDTIQKFRALGFDAAVEKKLTYENAARILGI
jgi:predicted TIM-barrel fold metal-dependent hydrolase